MILGLTIFAAVSSVVFNFVIAPVLKKNDDLNKEITKTKMKLKKYMLLLSQESYVKGKYSKFSSVLQGLPEDKDSLVAALSELELLAKSANVRIIDIRPQGMKDVASSKEVFIDFRAEAGIGDFLRFIYDLENSLSLLRIKRFQLVAKPNTQIIEGSFSVSRPDLE